MRSHVELGEFAAQAVVDEAPGQRKEEVTFHGSSGALDVESVFENAVQNGLADETVIAGFGGDIQGPGAEGFTARAAGLVLGVMDIEIGHLAVSQRADTTVETAFAPAVRAAGRAGMTLGGAADDA